jgi:hypothetical protein
MVQLKYSITLRGAVVSRLDERQRQPQRIEWALPTRRERGDSFLNLPALLREILADYADKIEDCRFASHTWIEVRVFRTVDGVSKPRLRAWKLANLPSAKRFLAPPPLIKARDPSGWAAPI